MGFWEVYCLIRLPDDIAKHALSLDIYLDLGGVTTVSERKLIVENIVSKEGKDRLYKENNFIQKRLNWPYRFWKQKMILSNF